MAEKKHLAVSVFGVLAKNLFWLTTTVTKDPLFICAYRVDGSPLQIGIVRRDVGSDELPNGLDAGDALLVLSVLKGDLPPPPVSRVGAERHRPLGVTSLSQRHHISIMIVVNALICFFFGLISNLHLSKGFFVALPVLCALQVVEQAVSGSRLRRATPLGTRGPPWHLKGKNKVFNLKTYK